MFQYKPAEVATHKLRQESRPRRSLPPIVFFCLISLCCIGNVLADEKPDRITVATWNLEWFFDNDSADNFSDLARQQSAPSENEWQWKLTHVAEAIAEMKPTILALQEVENRRVLFALQNELRDKHQLSYRIAHIEGFDSSTEQDVAILYRSGLVEYCCKEQSREMWNSKRYYNLNKHLFARFEWGAGDQKQRLTVAMAHLRATAESSNIRQQQARLLRVWLQPQIDAGENIIALGDFNSETDCDRPEKDSEIFILRGLETATETDDLLDLNIYLAKDQRATHLTGKQFDRILASQAMLADDPHHVDLVFQSIVNRKDLVIQQNPDKDHYGMYYKIPQQQRDISDHYPVMAIFLFK